MILCLLCQQEMQGVYSDNIRRRCYSCGGHSTITWQRDKEIALDRLKKLGVIEKTYQFKQASS